MRMDEDLRRALRRTEAPAGFTERTLARIASGDDRHEPNRATFHRWSMVLAASVSLVLVVGGSRYFAHRLAIHEAERARRDVETALRVVSRTLNDVQIKVAAAAQRIGADHEHPSPK
jgi:hypothetical protein